MTTIPFNTGWLFGPAPAARASMTAGSGTPVEERDLEAVTLPHTVAPLSWREWDPASWERCWLYRKHFPDPRARPGQRVLLELDAAMTGVEVVLNGHVLSSALGGYRRVGCELTPWLAAGDNELTVHLDSRFNLPVPPNRPAPARSRSVDFWQPGGLYGEARLRVVPEVFVADVFARVEDVLDATSRRVVLHCTLDAAPTPPDAPARPPLGLRAELRDGPRTLATSTARVALLRPGRIERRLVLHPLADIRLWDLDDPHCYEVVVTLTEPGPDGEGWHERRVRIGFREARFERHGFFLNGRRVQLFGLNRHQLFPFAGGAMAPRVQRRDAEILRHELNVNAVRCSHYPQAEAFLDACDDLGLLVFEEVPGWGYLGDAAWKALVERDVAEMVQRDRNHPSIVLWGTRPNETENDVTLSRRTGEIARHLDGSRPTAGAMAGRHYTRRYLEDVFAQNDYTSSVRRRRRRPELMPPRKDRPYLVSEAVGTLSGPARAYRRVDPQDVQQGQAEAHARVHDLAAAEDRYCGVLAWSAFDYPSGNGNHDRGLKCTGVADVFRVLKPGAAVYRSQVDPDRRPVIEPAFYWDFGPFSPANRLPRALICSNLDRVEVFVADRHFATACPDRSEYPHLRHPPSYVDLRPVDGSGLPELRLDGYLGGRCVLSRRFSSDPAGDRLLLALDDPALVADGVDTTRAVLQAVDRYGAPRPYVSGEVTLVCDGPARLIGDNPFPFAQTGGVGAVWLRSVAEEPGQVLLTARHPLLGAATARLAVQPPADRAGGDLPRSGCCER